MTQTELSQALRIEDVIALFGIKPVRNKYLCPFHGDKKPSASIKHKKFHCFSCGWHGDAIDFATGMGMDVPTLAKQFGLEYGGKVDKQALRRLQEERQERERVQELKDHQARLICGARQSFWSQKQDEDYFPIAYLDRLLDRLPLPYEVEAMLAGLERRYKY